MKCAVALLAGIFLLSAFMAKPPVPQAVLKQFEAVFPGAKNTVWHETEDSYDAYFESEGIRCVLCYGSSGKLLKSRRFYDAAWLSPFLRLKIAQKHPKKSIFGVTEVSDESGLTYHVTLEDENSWLQITTDPTGQLFETTKFNKAPK